MGLVQDFEESVTENNPVSKGIAGGSDYGFQAKAGNEYWGARLPVDQWAKDPGGSASKAWKTSTAFWDPTKWGNAIKGGMGAGGSGSEAESIDPAEALKRANDTTITPGSIASPTAGPSATVLGAYNPAAAAQINTGSAADPALFANLARLQQMAAGQGPSVSGMQLQQGREANLAAIMAQAQSSRGGFNPLVARTAMQSGADLNAKANQEAALQRLQEQQAAMGLIASQGGAMRGQDLATSTSQAQLQTQVSLENAAKDLQQKVAQGQITAGEAQQLFAAQQSTASQNAQLQQQAAIAQEQLRQQYLQMGYSVQEANQRAASAAADAAAKKQAGMFSAGSSIIGASLPFLGKFMGAGGGDAGSFATAGDGLLASASSSTDLPAAGGMAEAGGMMANQGGTVPGKAPKDGDHPDNDIIPARLSPGEFVLPRSLTKDKELMKLVHEKMAAHEAGKKQEATASGFADLLKAQADLNKKIEALQKQMKGK